MWLAHTRVSAHQLACERFSGAGGRVDRSLHELLVFDN